jgi:pimeloyl-ACP methyl ester carboxylesterase
MMCDERLFAPQRRCFEDHYRVLAPSFTRQDSIAAMAAHVLASVEAPDFNLAGLSMGGMVAMHVAQVAPERVRRLALLDTTCRTDAPTRRPVRARQIEAVRAGHLEQVVLSKLIPEYFAHANAGDPALERVVLEMALGLGAEVFARQSIALRDRPSFCAALSSVTIPTLILCGEDDRLCPVSRHAEMAAAMPKATLCIVRDAGHLSTLERPDDVNDALRHWLGRRQPCGADGLSWSR